MIELVLASLTITLTKYPELVLACAFFNMHKKLVVSYFFIEKHNTNAYVNKHSYTLALVNAQSNVHHTLMSIFERLNQ